MAFQRPKKPQRPHLQDDAIARATAIMVAPPTSVATALVTRLAAQTLSMLTIQTWLENATAPLRPLEILRTLVVNVPVTLSAVKSSKPVLLTPLLVEPRRGSAIFHGRSDLRSVSRFLRGGQPGVMYINPLLLLLRLSPNFNLPANFLYLSLITKPDSLLRKHTRHGLLLQRRFRYELLMPRRRKTNFRQEYCLLHMAEVWAFEYPVDNKIVRTVQRGKTRGAGRSGEVDHAGRRELGV